MHGPRPSPRAMLNARLNPRSAAHEPDVSIR
jgi:hypothetical protein